MEESGKSSFTRNTLLLGLGVSLFATYPLINADITWLNAVYYEPRGLSGYIGRDLQAMLPLTALGLIGLGVLWMSSRLDFVDEKDDDFRLLFWKIVTAIAVTWLAVMIFGVMAGENHPSRTGSFARESIGEAFLRMIAGLIGLILLLPVWIAWAAYPFLCTGLLLAGIFCLPRAIVFMTTEHGLRHAWEQGSEKGHFNEREVVQHLGDRSESAAHARALLKDSTDLLQETSGKATALQDELKVLTQRAVDDRKRLAIEDELSQQLAEVEKAQIQINILRERLGGLDEQRKR